jgi:hypothetical protein
VAAVQIICSERATMSTNSPTLRELFELRFNAMDRAVNVALDSMNKRLEGMNEFRQALRDAQSQSITRTECGIAKTKIEEDLDGVKQKTDEMLRRSEYEIQHQRVVEDIKMLRESKALLEGKASQMSVNITIAIAVMGLLVSIAAFFHK